jgi:hypothetical protein
MKASSRFFATGLLSLVASFGPQLAHATEGGADNIGKGSEGFFAGMLPAPGWYGVLYTNYYHASRLNDNHGDSSVPGFELSVEALAGRLFYMSDATVAGGRLGLFAIGSFAGLQSEAGATSAHRNGIGDITLGPTLGWDLGAFHPLVAVDLVLPVGSYASDRALNTGGNYYSVRPIFAFTHLSDGGLEVSAKFTYTFNLRNHETDYRSGQLFHVDYSASLPVTQDLRVGVNGYYLTQTTDDIQRSQAVNGDGNRARVAAIGPAMHYQFQKVGMDLKVLQEFGARNHTEGSSVWAKVVVPF